MQLEAPKATRGGVGRRCPPLNDHPVVWESVVSPEMLFHFELKMVRFGAFWVLFLQFGCLFIYT